MEQYAKKIPPTSFKADIDVTRAPESNHWVSGKCLCQNVLLNCKISTDVSAPKSEVRNPSPRWGWPKPNVWEALKDKSSGPTRMFQNVGSSMEITSEAQAALMYQTYEGHQLAAMSESCMQFIYIIIYIYIRACLYVSVYEKYPKVGPGPKIMMKAKSSREVDLWRLDFYGFLIYVQAQNSKRDDLCLS